MEFNELIKNFERVRTYMKDFFVYGFKYRNDFTQKSARTYDNERRRIESYLKEYIQTSQTAKGKSVFISADGNSIFQNPLYAAWKSKSFTDNDIMLHFYIPQLLHTIGPMTAEELSNEISSCFGMLIDPQVIRLKLKEYEIFEILNCQKQGKRRLYQLNSYSALETDDLYQQLLDAISYFQETAPLGIIGSTILDREQQKNQFFSFKHHFLMHTLDDGVLVNVLDAMKQHRSIQFVNKSYRRKSESIISGIPLKILNSTQTGRRYLCMYYPQSNRYSSIRLDSVSKVTLLEIVENYSNLKSNLISHLPKCWGVSFGGSSRIETIEIKLFINEFSEQFILQRLEREARGGTICKIEANLFQYNGTFYDTNELSPWIKTFIGRIVSIEGSNRYVINKLKKDLERLYQIYYPEEGENNGII